MYISGMGSTAIFYQGGNIMLKIRIGNTIVPIERKKLEAEIVERILTHGYPKMREEFLEMNTLEKWVHEHTEEAAQNLGLKLIYQQR